MKDDRRSPSGMMTLAEYNAWLAKGRAVGAPRQTQETSKPGEQTRATAPGTKCAAEKAQPGISRQRNSAQRYVRSVDRPTVPLGLYGPGGGKAQDLPVVNTSDPSEPCNGMYEIPMKDQYWTKYFKDVGFSPFRFGTGPDQVSPETAMMWLNPIGQDYSPGTLAGEGEGYGALAYANINPVSNFRLIVHALTVQQNRPAAAKNPLGGIGPSAIEVFWIGFNFNPTLDGLKRSNYFILKSPKDQNPNGKVQLGVMCESKGETILWTTPVSDTSVKSLKAMGTPTNPVLDIYEIVKIGEHVQVLINGALVLDYTNQNANPATQGCAMLSKKPGVVDDIPGTFAMYVEDALAVVFRVCFQELSASGFVVAPSLVP